MTRERDNCSVLMKTNDLLKKRRISGCVSVLTNQEGSAMCHWNCEVHLHSDTGLLIQNTYQTPKPKKSDTVQPLVPSPAGRSERQIGIQSDWAIVSASHSCVTNGTNSFMLNHIHSPSISRLELPSTAYLSLCPGRDTKSTASSSPGSSLGK